MLSLDIGVYFSPVCHDKEINMFINDAFAQTAGTAAAGSTMSMVVQLVLIFLVFYFILIRPQQKKIREHEAMLNAIKKGDKIITGGGVLGVVEKANDETLDVRIANGIVVTVYRATVRQMADDDKVSAQQVSKNKKK